MDRKELKIGEHYFGKVGVNVTIVRLDSIEKREGTKYSKGGTFYGVTNIATGKETVFKSSTKFRSRATERQVKDMQEARGKKKAAPRTSTKLSARSSNPPVQNLPKPPATDSIAVEDEEPPAGLAGAVDADVKKQEQENSAPHLIVEARAGTGKTWTLVEGLKALKRCDISKPCQCGYRYDKPCDRHGRPVVGPPSPQQAAVWKEMERSLKARNILFCAFNRSIAKELQNRVPAGCDALTNHALGKRAITNALGFVDVEEYRCREILSELYGMGPRDLFRQKPAFVRAVDEVVGLCKQNLVGSAEVAKEYGDSTRVVTIDDGEIEALISHYDVDMEGANKGEVLEWVPKVMARAMDVLADRKMDFNDMVWLPIVLDLPMTKYDLLLVDEAQDLNKIQQALVMKSGNRIVFCGDPYQCFVPGTRVSMEGGGSTLIEDIVEGRHDRHRVQTFNPNSGRISGRKSQGRKVEAVHQRDYTGPIVSVTAGGRTADCTPNHRWWVRFCPSVGDKFCLYLMERDSQYRVGICRMQYQCGMGIAARARMECADCAWILQIYDTELEARVAETLTCIEYGLPGLVFQDRGKTSPDQLFIDEVYHWIGCNVEKAQVCLEAFDRDIRYPIWQRDEKNYLSVTKGFLCFSSNLIDGCFNFRVDDGGRGGRWERGSIQTYEYSGPVYGIQVEPTERELRLYIANGIVTSNSIYGFAGADTESLNTLRERLVKTERGVETLPLTVTRRCGRAIVEEAKKYVPDFEAHHTNPDGLVARDSYLEIDGDRFYVPRVREGDMILCRVNAPLVSQCFKFIRQGKRAHIQGRDIGKGLISLVRKLRANTIPALVSALGDWLNKESAKENARRHPSENKLIALQDKHDCILCFTCGVDVETPEDVIKSIQAMFTDDKGGPGVKLSSIHKAKGLEADRVWFIKPEGAQCPHPMAKTNWQKEQELHLCYVAITRAISELHYVE